MAPKKRARHGEASSSNSNGAKLNLNTIYNGCFNEPNHPDAMETFKEFQNYRIRREHMVSIPFLTSTAFNFRYRGLLRQWKLMPYLKLPGYFYHNLVLIFYSNALCIFAEAKEEIVVIESYLMGMNFRIDSKVIVDSLVIKDIVDLVRDHYLASVQSFTYGTALSHVYEKLKIDCSADLVIPFIIYPISNKSLRKAKFTFHNGEWVCNVDLPHDVSPTNVEDEPQAPNTPPPPQAFSFDPMIAYLDGKFVSLVTHMYERFTSIDHCLQAIETRQNSMDINAFRAEWRVHNLGP
ncbi:hypothetical protein GQ457_02G018400 [Hibiscus cannabinus]